MGTPASRSESADPNAETSEGAATLAEPRQSWILLVAAASAVLIGWTALWFPYAFQPTPPTNGDIFLVGAITLMMCGLPLVIIAWAIGAWRDGRVPRITGIVALVGATPLVMSTVVFAGRIPARVRFADHGAQMEQQAQAILDGLGADPWGPYGDGIAIADRFPSPDSQLVTLGWLTVHSITVKACWYDENALPGSLREPGLLFYLGPVPEASYALVYCPPGTTLRTGGGDHLQGPWFIEGPFR